MTSSGLEGRAVAVSSVASNSTNSPIGRQTLRKAAWRLIPLLSICYMVAFMDRANVSYAALQMNRDLAFNAGIYGFGAGVFFISYAICELPSNFLLLKFGARRWIARIMFTWGILAAAMMFVHSELSFYTIRFLLGMAEAGFFPGVIYYLSLWFPQQVRARAVGRFYVAFPLGNVLMGLVAGPLLSLNGILGLKGWQWLFLLEALPAIVLSVIVWFILPDGPEDAKWMKPEERTWLLECLADDARQIASTGGRTGHAGIFGALKELRVALIGLFFFCVMGAYYAFSFSAPAIYQAQTGWSTSHVGLLIAAVALIGAAAMQVVGSLSDRRQIKIPYVATLSLIMAIGFAISGLVHQPWTAVAALALATLSCYAMQGPALSLSTTFLDGPSAAIGIAAINMLSIMGGFAGPVWIGWSTLHFGGTSFGVSMLAIPSALGALFILAVRKTSARRSVAH